MLYLQPKKLVWLLSWIEQQPSKLWVIGSNPIQITNLIPFLSCLCLYCAWIKGFRRYDVKGYSCLLLFLAMILLAILLAIFKLNIIW